MDATELIEALGLQPLPGEGGFYRETYRSTEQVSASALPARYTNNKCLSTAIYYLLTSQTISALHRLPTDEIYHFYLGDPVKMVQLYPDGTGGIITLGSDILAGNCIQIVVPKNVWQGSTLAEGGHFALMGTTMAPAFDFADFEIGERNALLKTYPKYADIIESLTRPNGI